MLHSRSNMKSLSTCAFVHPYYAHFSYRKQCRHVPSSPHSTHRGRRVRISTLSCTMYPASATCIHCGAMSALCQRQWCASTQPNARSHLVGRGVDMSVSNDNRCRVSARKWRYLSRSQNGEHRPRCQRSYTTHRFRPGKMALAG